MFLTYIRVIDLFKRYCSNKYHIALIIFFSLLHYPNLSKGLFAVDNTLLFETISTGCEFQFEQQH